MLFAVLRQFFDTLFIAVIQYNHGTNFFSVVIAWHAAKYSGFSDVRVKS
jgi:hypothetical protein